MPKSVHIRGLLLSLFALAMTSAPSLAQTTYTWTGAASEALPDPNSWFTPENWSASGPGSPPPGSDIANTVLVFDGVNRLTNDMDISISANSLTFAAGAGAFVIDTSTAETLTLGANGLTVAAGNANPQIFNAGLALGATQTWANNGTGLLTIGGGVNTTAGAFALTVGGTGNTAFGGVITGSGGLTKTGAGTVTLNAASNYTGPTVLAQGTLTPGINNAISTASRLQIGTFSGSGATAISQSGQLNLNLGTFSQTVAGLFTFNKNTAGTPHTITIASGQNLTVSNASGTGILTAFGAYDAATATNHVVTFTGGGSLVVNTPSAILQVGQAGTGMPTGFPSITTQGSLTTVNMQALSSFAATVSAFRVGDFTGTTNSGSATVTLAPTSTITTADFIMSSGRINSSTLPGVLTVRLGSVANTVRANNIYIGGDPPTGVSNPRSQGVLNFLNTSGTLTVRNQAGSGAANLFLGLQRNGSGTTQRDNSIQLNGHAVDLLLGTVQVGGFIGGTSTANTGSVTGTFSFNQGTVSAATLLVGTRFGAATGTTQNNTGSAIGTVNVAGTGTLTVTGTGASALSIGSNTTVNSTTTGSGAQVTTGTVNVSGGVLNVPNGGVSLATNTGTYAGGSATFTTSGTLSITGGSVTVGGDIVKGAATSPGTASATLILNGPSAALDLTGHNIGGAAAIETLTFQQGSLANVAQINNGTTGLIKTGTGTLTLAGTHTYSGPTNVNGGTVAVTGTTGAGSNFTVASASTLQGGGIIGGSVAVQPGGTLRGGNGDIGVLTVNGNIVATSAAGNAPHIAVTADTTTASRIDAAGTSTVMLSQPTGADPFIIDLNIPTLIDGNSYVRTIITAGGGFFTDLGGPLPPDTFFGLGTDYVVQSQQFASFTGVSLATSANGQELVLSFTPVTPVPEPATVTAFAAAALGLGGVIRRRRMARS